MEMIAPGRTHISDRFPVASFTVAVPEDRYFEIACTTDPRLFHRDHSGQRTSRNFFSSRSAGLLRAPRGQTTYLLPPEQLQRFAGARRVYYALATYGGPRGEGARFSLSPQTLDQAPSIALASDFTGRTLDRSRIGRPVPESHRYGAAEVPLTWGGDDALAAAAARPVYAGPAEYDDGFDGSLWKQPAPRAAPAARPSPAPAPARPSRRQYRGAAFASDEYGDMDTDDPDSPSYEEAEALASRGGAGEDAPEDSDGDGAPEAYGAAGLADRAPDEYEDAVELAARGIIPDGLRRMEQPSRMEGPGSPHEQAPSRTEGHGFAAPHYGRPAEAPVEQEWEDAPALAAAGARVEVLQPAAAPSSRPQAAVAPEAREPLSGKDPDYREDEVTEEPLPETAQGLQAVPTAPARLGIPEKFTLVQVVARAESGRDAYSAINADTEYNDPSHRAYHRYHIGLSWGLIQFTQRGGALGRVLAACERRDPALFQRAFGEHAPELLRVTNAATEEARVAPVGGRLLWEPYWTDLFRAAGALGPFQAAQNEVAITDYLDVNLPLAGRLGFVTDRALAMLYDRCVNMGNGGGKAWVVRHAGPVRTQGQLTSCLRALGHADLGAFQASVPGLHMDGQWGPDTHAAMTQALRALGPGSPVAVPTLPEMLDRLVAAAVGTRFHHRLRTLRDTPDLRDLTYQVP